MTDGTSNFAKPLQGLSPQVTGRPTANKGLTLDANAAVPDDVRTVPTGTCLDYAGVTAPTGFLMCDGSAVSRTEYARLFAVIGVLYGTGDGTNTFNVPDCRGRVTATLGTHADVNTLGDNEGEATVGNRRIKHGTSVVTSPTNTAVSAGTPTGANTAVSAGTPAGTNTAVSAGTPAGTNSAPTFTGSGGTTGNDSPDHSHGPGSPNVDFWGGSGGSAIFASGGAFATGNPTQTGGASARHTHSFTPAGSVSAPTFTGTAMGTHNHTFTGTAMGTHNHTWTGDPMSTHNHTISGGQYGPASSAAMTDQSAYIVMNKIIRI